MRDTLKVRAEREAKTVREREAKTVRERERG